MSENHVLQCLSWAKMFPGIVISKMCTSHSDILSFLYLSNNFRLQLGGLLCLVPIQNSFRWDLLTSSDNSKSCWSWFTNWTLFKHLIESVSCDVLIPLPFRFRYCFVIWSRNKEFIFYSILNVYLSSFSHSSLDRLDWIVFCVCVMCWMIWIPRRRSRVWSLCQSQWFRTVLASTSNCWHFPRPTSSPGYGKNLIEWAWGNRRR